MSLINKTSIDFEVLSKELSEIDTIEDMKKWYTANIAGRNICVVDYVLLCRNLYERFSELGGIVND